LPSVNRLYSELKARGLEVLLVSVREDPGLVKRTVQERGYVAPVLLDRTGDVTGKAYGVWGTPTSYLIDRQGQLVGRIGGARPWESPAARTLVLALLEGR
jgi:peroxiredoxin